MTTNTNGLTARASVAAARGALIAMALAAYTGHAVAQSGQELTKPTSTTEIGAGAVSDGSYKAGEYNGLEKKGGFGIGNIDWRGGAAFDSDSALRWRIKGIDLGLQTRSLYGEVGAQGKFRLNFGFDELRRNRSDSYQTPYNGAGSNTLTLPGTWLVPTVTGSSSSNTAVNNVSARGLVKTFGDAPYISTATNSTTMGALLTPTAAQRAQVDAAADADLASFHNVNLSTTRTRYDLGLAYSFNPNWSVDASFRPEHKDGLKPMGTVSRNTGGDISTVIPDVIDNDHNQINMSLNFRRARGFGQVGYYGSFFKNNVPFMSWQNWATGPAGTGTLDTMSSTPGNDFNQFNVTGGVNLSSTTKLVANGSYARNTQNDAFLTDATTALVPVSSLNGLVVSTAFNVKFTAKPAKKVNLAAAYKFDDRDNRTSVHIFQYADAGEAPSANANFPAGPNNPLGAVLAQNANANRPYSRKLNQVTLDADYAVAKGQWIKGAYEFQKIDRQCNGSWISCADAPTTNDNILRAEWRANVREDLTARVGYEYAARRAPDYNENAFLALVPYANVSLAAATGGATALSFMNANGWNGWGPAAGYAATTGNMQVFFPNNNALAKAVYANNNLISELPGMRRYFVADRNRDKVRSSLDWQATDELSLHGGLDYNTDNYPHSTYGVQDARGWAVNLDGTYALGDDLSLNAFYTYEDQRSITAGNTYTANSNVAAITNGQPGVVGLSGNSCDGYTTLQQRNNNNKLDPCLNWSADMLDKVHTLGFGLRKKANALDLTGNLILTRARSDNNVSGGNWANNILDGPGAAPTTIAAWFISASPLPTVTTDTAEVRLNGKYTIDKRQSVRVAYSFLRMKASDWVYDGMQIGAGTIAGVLPSNEQGFNYTVNVVGVSYILSF
jgi:MtrB/PioB family decaheme-associated outer membrane protein